MGHTVLDADIAAVRAELSASSRETALCLIGHGEATAGATQPKGSPSSSVYPSLTCLVCVWGGVQPPVACWRSWSATPRSPLAGR